MTRVAIVDDHPALREGTAGLLAREPDIDAIALLARWPRSGRRSPVLEPPDVVVQDIRLGRRVACGCWPGRARRTGEQPAPAAGPRIILWTAYDYPQYAAYARRAGASGFVVKTAPVAELVGAIRTVAAGGTHFGTHADLGVTAITPRELEVLRLVVDGMSNDAIGGELGITTRTVEAHLTRLFERSGTQSRTELATRAVREGWLDLPSG
ncbi:MAG: response regulator transcription factor [Chloroflexota bacterium]